MAIETKRRSHVEADRPLARQIGARLRRARLQASLTQAQLAEGRYTKAYVSALENGLVKPSMAALHFFAGRLGLPVEHLLSNVEQAWTRLDADLRLASGDWPQAVDAFSSLLEVSPSDAVRAELLLGLAEGQARLGNGPEAVRAASEAAALFASRERPREAAWAAYWQAFGLHEMERGDQATAVLNRLLDQIGAGLNVEPDLPVRILIALAMIATGNDEPRRGLAYLEQARSRLADLDDRKRALFLYSLALSYRELGDYEAAMSTGTQCLAAFKAADLGADVATIENELALVYLAVGNLKRARDFADEARTYFSERDDRWRLAHVIETQGQIALASGSPGEALALSTESLNLAESCDNKKAALDAQLLLARAQRAQGNLEGAAQTLKRAGELAEAFGRHGQLQAVLTEWSDVMAETGDLAAALALSRRAVDVARR